MNSNGTKLQLRLGRLKGYGDEVLHYNTDHGFRWSFIGSKIPMPVRNGTWFNGFPENIMLEWLKANGWHLRTNVCMCDGKATVYELPKAEEPSKANEPTFGTDKYPAYGELDRPTFECVIRKLVNECNKVTAVRLYRYVHGGTLHNANAKVSEIYNML